MDAGNLSLEDEVYRIVGAACTVLNELGHGLYAKPDENALAGEFRLAGIGFAPHRRFPVRYKHGEVAEEGPDLIAFDPVITRFTAGTILYFKRAKFEWERLVLSDHSRSLASVRG